MTTNSRRRRNPFDRSSPIRRVASYTSTDRFRYGEPGVPMARRASTEILYGNPTSGYQSFHEYPTRRWSDEFTPYNGRSNSFSHFDRFQTKRYGGGNLSPRSQQYAGASYKNNPTNYGTRGREMGYGYDQYGDRTNYHDYPNPRSGRLDYQDYYYPNKVDKIF